MAPNLPTVNGLHPAGVKQQRHHGVGQVDKHGFLGNKVVVGGQTVGRSEYVAARYCLPGTTLRHFDEGLQSKHSQICFEKSVHQKRTNKHQS